MKQKIIVICGPTAVGKSNLAVEIAKNFNGEIISADSMQIYKELNIGTAKVTKQEMQNIPHFLLDFISPEKSYSVAEFKQDATQKITEIASKNKLPIICGGTGLYIEALLYPYNFCNSMQNSEIRDKYKLLAQENGNEYVYNILNSIDSVSAQKLHPNDLKRVIRALEIYETTGKTKTSQTLKESPYDFLMIFLSDDRELLYSRINERVEKMFDSGLENEVKSVVKKYNLTLQNQSMQAIGYKEFFEYFDGKIDLQELKEKIKMDSRHYAKRQITWFKRMTPENFCYKNKAGIFEKITKFVNQTMQNI